MLRLIVVPLDGSSFSEQVLPLAVRLAERHHARLEIVHVFEALAPYLVQGAPPIDPGLDSALRRDRKNYLEDIAQRLRGASSLKVDARVIEGTEVATTLADYCSEHHVDLVIMATHGRGGLSRFWVGSVSTGVVRRSDTPVLLVRPSEPPASDVAPSPLRHILLPLDGTPADDEALEDAVAVAEDGAEFFLLHVRAPVVYFAEPEVSPEIQAELEAASQSYVDTVAKRIRARGFTASTHVIVEESAARAILQVAEAWKIDLIVMETHARTGVSRVTHGSATDKVIRSAHVPVLVHRRPLEADGRKAAAGAESEIRTWS
jgi:nucleotide-binding universal stress UspA family protein